MRNCAFIGELLASAFGENHAPGAVRPFCSAYRIAIPEFGGASNEHSHAGIMDQGFGCLQCRDTFGITDLSMQEYRLALEYSNTAIGIIRLRRTERAASRFSIDPPSAEGLFRRGANI